MMFVFLSVSIRCLTKGKLKKRKHIFLKQYAFQTKGSSAVDESLKQTLATTIITMMLIICDFPLQYDTDGSGQIEFPEFCNMMSHKMNASDDKEAVKKSAEY